MTFQTVVLHVPDHIYEQARHLAETSAQSLEAVLLQELEQAFLPPLPEEEQSELNAMAFLSDDALWTIAREKMPPARQARLQTLMDGNTKGTLTSQQLPELEQLVEQSQKLMLRKGKAAALLTERGYQVTRQALNE